MYNRVIISSYFTKIFEVCFQIWHFFTKIVKNLKLTDWVKEIWANRLTECGQKTKFLEESVKGDTEISLDFNLCIYISQQLKVNMTCFLTFSISFFIYKTSYISIESGKTNVNFTMPHLIIRTICYTIFPFEALNFSKLISFLLKFLA